MSTLPNPNPILNDAIANYTYIVDPSLAPVSGNNTSTIATTQINEPIITSTKLANPTSADIGATITYTLLVSNTGNTPANDVKLTDNIPNGTVYINNTLTVNGLTVAGDPATGISVGIVNPGTTSTVTFQVVVNTTPNPNPMKNTASGTYKFTLDPSIPDGQTGTTTTNIAIVTFNRAAFDTGTGIIKQVNKNYAQIGDTLVYTTTLKNTGTTTALNVVFSDTIPVGTTFVPGSVTINGVANAGNPQAGINIGTVGLAAVNTIVFSVVVNTIPVPNPIPNNNTVKFSYIVDPSLGTTTTGGGNSNTVNTQINQAIINNPSGS
ncbi:MAG: DUF11 domain-containing protein, partial [Cellulosilyticaceae bacterium]